MNQMSKTRMVVVLVILASAITGISYLHYQDMVQPLPDFKSLQQIPADGMKYELAQPRGPSVNVSFEFTDQSGKRYQTEYMGREEAKTIEDALQAGGVVLWVGPWKSALKSDSKFTVYHMTRKGKVLIDYKEMAERKKTEQIGAAPVILMSLVLFAGIAAFAVWRYKRQHRLPAGVQASS
jgi:hypothetical protein